MESASLVIFKDLEVVMSQLVVYAHTVKNSGLYDYQMYRMVIVRVVIPVDAKGKIMDEEEPIIGNPYSIPNDVRDTLRASYDIATQRLMDASATQGGSRRDGIAYFQELSNRVDTRRMGLGIQDLHAEAMTSTRGDSIGYVNMPREFNGYVQAYRYVVTPGLAQAIRDLNQGKLPTSFIVDESLEVRSDLEKYYKLLKERHERVPRGEV